jgi:MFS family permease
MDFPPGTVRLEDLDRSADEIILQPQPSTDPNDPLNWSSPRKYVNFALVCTYVVLVFGLVNMMPITWIPMSSDYPSFTFAILNDSYAAGCGALCIGGIVLVPFSLKYGRRPVYILSLALECGISVWSARITNVADLMLVNIFSCFVGALCEIMVQMTIADTFFVHQRGRMNSIYVWVLTIGSSLAPLAAGYVTINSSLGWRWVWWITAIIIGALVLTFFFFYEETKYDCETLRGVTRTLSVDEAAPRPDVESKSASVQDKYEGPRAGYQQSESTAFRRPSLDPNIPVKTYVQKLALTSSSATPFSHYLRHTYQPFIILTTIPGIFYMAIINGAIFAGTIMSISTYSTYMTLPPYNFGPSGIGLMGLPSFIGVMIGAAITGPASDWLIVRLARRNGGVYEPEMRLWLMLLSTPFLAAGYVIFGVGLDKGWGWPVVCVGLGLASFGSAAPMALTLTYLTDAYTEVGGVLLAIEL